MVLYLNYNADTNASCMIRLVISLHENVCINNLKDMKYISTLRKSSEASYSKLD